MEKIVNIDAASIIAVDKGGVCRAMTLAWCNEMLKGKTPNQAWVDRNYTAWAKLQAKYRAQPENSPIINKLKLIEKKVASQFKGQFAGDSLETGDINLLPTGAYYMGLVLDHNQEGHALGFYFSNSFNYYINQNTGIFREANDTRTQREFVDAALAHEIDYYEENDIQFDGYQFNRIERKVDEASCCYITTATCRSLNLDEDCEELNLLRSFRDNILLESDEHKFSVELYYLTAPIVVKEIDRHQNAPAIYSAIYEAMILPSILAIKNGDFLEASRLYESGVLGLIGEFFNQENKYAKIRAADGVTC